MSKRPDQPPACTPSPTETILESISDGIFTVDLDWRITSFNRTAGSVSAIHRMS